MSTPPSNFAVELEKALRDEICRVGLSLYNRGFVHASAGNISARLDDGYLITPTDACLGTLSPVRLAKVLWDGQHVSGDTPSKTLALHRRIYESAPDAGCVIHTHSTHLVALTLQGVWQEHDILPPITPYFVMKVGHVPLVPYRRPGDPEVADWVARRMYEMARRGLPLRAVMLDRLGPTVWHQTPAAASVVLEELEETARLWMMCSPKPAPLSPAQLAVLKQQFGAVW